MALLDFIGAGTQPRTPYQLERDIEDALEGGNARWGVAHASDGSHKAFPDMTVEGDTSLGGAMTTTGARFSAAAYDVTLSGTTNDLKGVDGLPLNYEVIRISASGDATLTGIVPAATDKIQHLRLINASSSVITLAHNTGSTTAYRFACPGDADFPLINSAVADLTYDRSSGNWRVFGSVPMIKSIQRGTIDLTAAGGLTSNTATITAVNTAKTLLTQLGQEVSGAVDQCRLELTNSTTVTAYRSSGATANDFRIGYQVVELY